MATRSPIGERLAAGEDSLFGKLFELLAEAVTIRATNGEIVYANRAALNQLGFDSLEALRARSTGSIIEDYIVQDEHGRPLTHDDVPSIRLLRGERVAPRLIRSVNRKTGDVRWTLLKTTPLHDDDGELLGAMTVIEDVTAVKTAEIRTRVLAESGRRLASSLDYERTLRTVADVAVPSLADFCGVDLVDARGSLERVAAVHADPIRQTLVARLTELGDTVIGPGSQTLRVVATGVSDLYRYAGEAETADGAASPEHARLLEQLGLRSVLIVPMRVPDRIIGAMTLATDISQRRLADDDVELAEQLGRRAAIAVENSRLHAQLARVAETLQQSLLPAQPPEIPGWELATLYRPLETEMRIDVGGDFYELFEHEGTWFVILGDVVGKGVAAASLTALMRYGARVASRAEPAPCSILSRLDESLHQYPGDALATALCMSLGDGRVTISSAGHPPAVIVERDGTLREVPKPDALLGAFAKAERHEEAVAVGPGGLIVLYTDGVIDLPGASERFGTRRLHSLLRELAGSPPQDVIDRLAAELDAFAPLPGGDDVAVLALRPRP